MTFSQDFQFSQASLQDFVDCRRRFYLRYIRQLAWPAPQSEPILENERAMLDGALFHRLVQQYLIGLPPERLSRLALGEALQTWWENFLSSKGSLDGLDDPSADRYAEYNLSAPLAGFRLVAKYDLIVVLPGADRPRFLIYDWKTSRFRTNRSSLAARLQTRVYPFLLARAGAALNNGQPLHPDQVEMAYWFASFPDRPEIFPYSLAQYSQDQDDLSELIQTVARLAETDDAESFPLTLNEQKCVYCIYRSLCDRGQHAGDVKLDESEASAEPAGLELDFDQISELEF